MFKIVERSEGTADAPMQARGKVLLATHGEGRGRPSSFLRILLDRMAECRPALFRQVVLWRTGSPPPSLDDVQAVVFFLSDPITYFQACHADARDLADAARARGIKLLNPPEALDNSTKGRQAQLWKDAGLPCAGGATARNESEADAILERATYPVIVRPDDLHVQQGVFVCGTKAQALKHLTGARYPVTVLEYIDTRESWRGQQPDSLFAEYFHKKRSMVFGSRVVNNHIFFSTQPIVGGKSCTFFDAQSGSLDARISEMVRADIAFGSAPAEAPETMCAAVAALGFDIAAIDYSTKSDGSIVLWEANPYFHLPHWSAALLSHHRRLPERVPRMLDAMGAELESLLEPARRD